MLAIVAPGQGSQTPGMLATWCEDSGIRSYIESASEHLNLDLLRLGTTADADEIRDTANAQPLIVITGLVAASSLNVDASVVAGHSVGEITAAALAGVISDHDALSLVQARGREMADVAQQHSAGMSAILGGDRDVVIAALMARGLVAANENGAGQIVAAGSLEALGDLAENPPAGARVRPLAVAGAFHTPLMASAAEAVRAIAEKVSVHTPSAQLISNKDGAVVADGREVIDRIVDQIASPVRWDLCMKTLANIGVTGVIELAPAGTLVGLIKRAEPGIETFALKSPEEIDGARVFAQSHS